MEKSMLSSFTYLRVTLCPSPTPFSFFLASFSPFFPEALEIKLGTNWSESLNHTPCVVQLIPQTALPESRIVTTCLNAAS